MKSSVNSGWTVKIAREASKQLDKLDRPLARRSLEYLRRLQTDIQPQRLAEQLKGNFSKLSHFRVGDYRLICELDTESLTILVLRVAHRKSAYRR